MSVKHPVRGVLAWSFSQRSPTVNIAQRVFFLCEAVTPWACLITILSGIVFAFAFFLETDLDVLGQATFHRNIVLHISSLVLLLSGTVFCTTWFYTEGGIGHFSSYDTEAKLADEMESGKQCVFFYGCIAVVLLVVSIFAAPLLMFCVSFFMAVVAICGGIRWMEAKRIAQEKGNDNRQPSLMEEVDFTGGSDISNG